MTDKFQNNAKYLTEIINKYGKEIPNEISLALKQILEQKLIDINFEDDMISKESLDIIIQDYMRKIAPTLKQVSKQIADILMSKMQSEYEEMKKNN
ncbi:MAG: hypothetical protein WAZ12_04755 [Candidatus Absconditicoccaceae bacterium]